MTCTAENRWPTDRYSTVDWARENAAKGTVLDRATGTAFERASNIVDFTPHTRGLGMRVVEADTRHLVVELPYRSTIIGNPVSGVIHGGAVSALMDTCGGAAVMSHPSSPGGTATIDLRIDYMRAATPGQAITARATCYHVTRSVAFVRATACDEDADRPVATASGAFTVEGGR